LRWAACFDFDLGVVSGGVRVREGGRRGRGEGDEERARGIMEGRKERKRSKRTTGGSYRKVAKILGP
jgi:hypothetical protein